MVLSIEHAGDIRLFPTGVDGFVRGHLDLRDGLGQFLVGIPASEGIPLPGGHLVQLDHSVSDVPFVFVLRAPVGVIGQGIPGGHTAPRRFLHPGQRHGTDGVIFLTGKIGRHGKLDPCFLIRDLNFPNGSIFNIVQRAFSAVCLGIGAVQVVETIERKFRVLVGSRRIGQINVIRPLGANQQVAVVGVNQVQVFHGVLAVGVGLYLDITCCRTLQCALQTLLQYFHKGVFRRRSTEQFVVEQTNIRVFVRYLARKVVYQVVRAIRNHRGRVLYRAGRLAGLNRAGELIDILNTSYVLVSLIPSLGSTLAT